MTTAAATVNDTTTDEFKPIALSTSGHRLEASKLGLVPTSDKLELPQPGHCIGAHALCGGNFIVYRATATANAGVCDRCGYRFEYALGLKTYADLRRVSEFKT